MSSAVPKKCRPSSKRPSKFSDIDKNAQHICKLIKIALDKPCRLTGSYFEGIPFLDSDIDISVDKKTTKDTQKVAEISKLFNVKIDISQTPGGFEIEL